VYSRTLVQVGTQMHPRTLKQVYSWVVLISSFCRTLYFRFSSNEPDDTGGGLPRILSRISLCSNSSTAIGFWGASTEKIVGKIIRQSNSTCQSACQPDPGACPFIHTHWKCIRKTFPGKSIQKCDALIS